jgi:transcriptional regulator with XRE-family HTH domain
LVISADQVRAGRGLVNLTVQELAKRSGIHVSALQRIEHETLAVGPKKETLDKIQKALEEAGVVFMADGFGVTKRPAAQE